MQALALEAEGAVGRVMGELPERLADADHRALALEQRLENMANSLAERMDVAAEQSEARLTRLAEIVGTVERSGAVSDEALRAAVVRANTERLALQEGVEGASEKLEKTGAALKNQGRIAAVTVDSVALKLAQLESTLGQHIELLEQAAAAAERLEKANAAVAAMPAAGLLGEAGPASEPERVLELTPAQQVATHSAPAAEAGPDALVLLRKQISDLAELATLLGDVLSDRADAALGAAATVADRAASLRRLTELLARPVGPKGAANRLYSLPQARLLADKFMTRFERLLRDAGDGNANDLLPVILLTTDVGKVYLALSRLASSTRVETTRAVL